MPSHSRGALPEFCLIDSLKREGAGNAGCPIHPQPVCRKNAHGRRHRFTGINRHSLRNGFNGLLRALPGDEFLFVTVIGELTVLRNPVGFAKTSADLTPATGARTTRLHRPRPVFAQRLRRVCTSHEALMKTEASPFVCAPLFAHEPKPALRPILRARRCRVHRIPSQRS
jgi:hypothetical protein